MLSPVVASRLRIPLWNFVLLCVTSITSFLFKLNDYISALLQRKVGLYESKPEKAVDISRRQSTFPREMTSEKPSQKFHADDVSLSWLVMPLRGKSASTNQKHYSSLGSNPSSLLLSFPKKSFRVKTSDVDVKCRMFLRQFKNKKAANRCTTENVCFTGTCFVFCPIWTLVFVL